VPSIVMATGGVILTMMLRRWTRQAAASAVAPGAAPRAAVASDDEMARLQRALRDDGDDD
jgi:hypothetical protein